MKKKNIKMKKIKNFGSFVKENVQEDIQRSTRVGYSPDSEIKPIGQLPEVEESEYIGDRLLKELAEKTGGVLEGNTVIIDNKKVDFFSETESFHVDGEKFKTVDEVINHLDGSIKESRRTPRSFRKHKEQKDLFQNRPEIIEDLRRSGYKVKEADKAVDKGLNFVKKSEVYVELNSKNIWREFKLYSYKVDRNNNVTDEILKINDDLCDAIRYAMVTHIVDRPKIRKIFY